MITDGIRKLVGKGSLTEPEMIEIMNQIMNGEATPAQIGSFITALRMKGETAEELTGAARVMRKKSVKIKIKNPIIVDTCGTGGDGSNTFNISTTAAFVVAGSGITVAKHGNRSVSSNCGSADVLKALGVNIEAGKDTVEKCINENGIGFLFAPSFHRAMKYAVGPRGEIGIRTIFNILGPLTNPAMASAQVIGIYSREHTELLATVLKNLGSKHALVVHGEDGLDEITLTAKTRVSELKNGEINTYLIEPEELNMKRCTPEDILGGSPEENANITLRVLKGEKGPKTDIVLLNAAAAILASEIVENLAEGIKVAKEAIENGNALKKLLGLVRISNRG